MTATNDRHDVVVVGVGGVGSATTYELARRGLDVLGLERFDVPHAMGSSHGSTRIFRLAQHEHPDYVPLARHARERWRALEAETGRDLLHTTGSLHGGREGGEYVAGVVEACEAGGLDYEVLSGSEVNERFPGYEVPEDYEVVYQPDGGFLDPERCISAHVSAAAAEGATVRARERVVDWTDTGDGVRVDTDKGTYHADHLVVTAGAWAGTVLPALDDWLTPVRRVMAWFQPEETDAFAPDSFPVFTLKDERSDVYGFPIHDRPGFKIGGDPGATKAIDPDNPRPEPTPTEEERLRAEAERFFPDGAGPTLSLVTCVYTESADEHFLLGRHPDHDRVTVGAGFTGHGFKFAAALGDVLADIAVDGESEHCPDLFDLGRVRE